MRLAVFENRAEQSQYKVILQHGSWRKEYSFDVEEVDLNGQRVLVGHWDLCFEQDFLRHARLRGWINRVVLQRLRDGSDTSPIDIDEPANNGNPMADSKSYEEVYELVSKHGLLDVLQGIREVMETGQALTFNAVEREYLQILIQRLQDL
jgi:hypothetical protein